MGITSRDAANEFERLVRRGPVSRTVGTTKRAQRRGPRRNLPITRRAGLTLAVVALMLGALIHDERKQAAAAAAHPYPYGNCDAARAAGAENIRVGDPRYASHQDRDRDGVACEPFR